MPDTPTALAGLCVLVGAIFRVAAIRPMTDTSMVIRPFMDDGFYYLEIARNVVRLGRFTFDGINATNGFHPLWQLLLALTALVSLDDFRFLQAAMLVGVAFFALTSALLFKFVASQAGRVAGLAAVTLWTLSPNLITWQNQGMENTVYLPLLILALLQINSYVRNPHSLRSGLLLGVTFGLTMLARSDAVLFVIISIVAIGIRTKACFWPSQRSLLEVFGAMIGIALLFGIGYLLFNTAIAGSPLSVSGSVKLADGIQVPWQIKATSEAIGIHLSQLWRLFSDFGGVTWGFNWRVLALQAILAIWVLLLMLWYGYRLLNISWPIHLRNVATGIDTGLLVLLVYTMLHTLILTTVLRDILRWTPWYTVPQVLTILVVLPMVLFPRGLLERDLVRIARTHRNRLGNPAILRSAKNRLRPVLHHGGALFFLLVVLAPSIWVLSVPLRSWIALATSSASMVPSYELAVWLNENVPPESRIGMFDAGATGYFADAHIINLDGLVNTPNYARTYKRSGSFAQYVIDTKLDYVVTYTYPQDWGPTDDSEVCSRLVHVNTNPAPWGRDSVSNYFMVYALQYHTVCQETWQSGFAFLSAPVN